MPHRPERGGTASTNASTSIFARVNGLSEEAAAHIMRPSSVGSYSHTAGVVTPLMNSKPWLNASHPGLRAMLPVLEKPTSSDSHDRSKHDEDCTVATLTTEASADEMEKREATANALLLVSTAAVRHDNIASFEKEETTSSLSNVPFKKRKRHLDFLRRNNDDGTLVNAKVQPCHVSPVSHSPVEGRTVSREEVTPERQPRRHLVETQRSHSYDSKDSHFKRETTQELPETAKIHSASDITLPAQVGIPHFPSVLHQVLCDPEFNGSVVSWLPDGESWKVLRWDALRREVLPRYFSDLRDENGAGCGTIDAFLWHLTAWGFDEIKDGSAVGAYRHDLFIRGAQKLSNKMRFNAMSSEQGPKTVSPIRSAKGDNRLLLQVPTLASMDANTPSRRFRHEDQSSADSQGGTGRPSAGPLNWTGYRAEDPYLDAKAWGHYYGDHSRMYSGAIYNHHSYHRAMPSDSVGPQAPLYSPPQVRSGRGAMRTTGAIRITTSSSPLTTPSLAARSSFPVSNRGKGRKNTGSRPAIPPADSFVPKDSHDTNSAQALAQASFEEAQRIGNSVNGIAIAISRKAKRKLPLSRKNDRDDQSTSLVAEEI